MTTANPFFLTKTKMITQNFSRSFKTGEFLKGNIRNDLQDNKLFDSKIKYE